MNVLIQVCIQESQNTSLNDVLSATAKGQPNLSPKDYSTDLKIVIIF